MAPAGSGKAAGSGAGAARCFGYNHNVAAAAAAVAAADGFENDGRPRSFVSRPASDCCFAHTSGLRNSGRCRPGSEADHCCRHRSTGSMVVHSATVV